MRKLPKNAADHPISVQAQRALKARRDAEAWLSALEADTRAAVARLSKDREIRMQAARTAWAESQAERCRKLWKAVVSRVAEDTHVAFDVKANDVAEAERWLTSDARWIMDDRQTVCLFADADPQRLRRLHLDGTLRASIRENLGFRRWEARRARAAAEGRSARYKGERGALDLARTAERFENARIALALHGAISSAARWLGVSPHSFDKLFASENGPALRASIVVYRLSAGASLRRAMHRLKDVDAPGFLDLVRKTAEEFGIPVSIEASDVKALPGDQKPTDAEVRACAERYLLAITVAGVKAARKALEAGITLDAIRAIWPDFDLEIEAARVVCRMRKGLSLSRALPREMRRKNGQPTAQASRDLVPRVRRLAALVGAGEPIASEPASAPGPAAKPLSPRVAALLRGASAGAIAAPTRKLSQTELIARAGRRPNAAGIAF